MSAWKQQLQAWKKSHFVRFGLPLMTLVVGGSFMTVDFQRLKYEAQREKEGKEILKELGLSKKVDLRAEAERQNLALANFNWRNIRGPRPWEDDEPYINARAEQVKALDEAWAKADEIMAQRKLERSKSGINN